MDAAVEHDICDIPFDGYFAPEAKRQARRSGCPFSRRHSPGQHGAMGGIGHGAQEFHRFPGPADDGQRGPACHRRDGWGHHGPHNGADDRIPPFFKHAHDAKPHDFRGPHGEHFGPAAFWFARRGPAESQTPWSGAWGGLGQQKP
ncbi:unnamed protein product [Spodoptera exigua]|uniref:Uncharacterized protein n=1 Tax=Spodoptera exigua TaxID=7107 RepID=A0A922M7G6_SPOEX|nr:hypothetical protein HF086_003718 [Spodoptera exigua]CAH0663702.1 unnamed protein product [Spodoptera exigua]